MKLVKKDGINMGWKDTETDLNQTPSKSWRDTEQDIQEVVEPAKVGKIEAAARGATQGLTLGTGEEIGAGLFSILDAARRKLGIETEEEKVNRQLQEQGFKGDIPTIEQKDILSQYRQMRDVSRAADVKAKEDQIEAYTGGELVGSLAPVLGTGGAAALAQTGAKAAGIAAAKAGAKYGAVSGLGTSEADVTKGEVGELAKDIGISTAAGTIGGGVIGATPGIISKGLGKAKEMIKNTEDIGKRIVDQFDQGLKGIKTTGNKQREIIEQGLSNESKILREKINTESMTEAKNLMSESLEGKTKDITGAINKAIARIDEELKIFPDDSSLKSAKNILVQEKERLIQEPEGFMKNYKPLKEVQDEADTIVDKELRLLKGKQVGAQGDALRSVLQYAAKLKPGSKIEGVELKRLNDEVPLLANELGLPFENVLPLIQDVAKLKFKSPSGAQQEVTKLIKQYNTPKKVVDTQNGVVYVMQGEKRLFAQPYRPDALPPQVQKNPSEIFNLMRNLRDVTVASPDKVVRKVGKELDDIFDAELKQGMPKDKLDMFEASREMYRTKYDIDEALGEKAFNAAKGSTAEVKGWSDIRRAMEPLEDVSVVSQNRPLAEDIFEKIGKLTKQPDLLPRLKEQATLSNLAEGQSGLVPTKASYLSIGAEKIANIAGRGINYATKGNKLVKMDSAGLKALASRTKSSSPELSNFLESLSNVENHTRRNALLFAASQKAGLKEELDKYFKDENE